MLKRFNNTKKEVKAVADGILISQKNIKDKTFAEGHLGWCFGIDITSGVIKSPISGKIIQIFPTNHAFIIEVNDSLQVLVHVGIDTVTMKGDGFKQVASIGDSIKAGEEVILEVDLNKIKDAGKSSETIIIFLEETSELFKIKEGLKVNMGDSLFKLV